MKKHVLTLYFNVRTVALWLCLPLLWITITSCNHTAYTTITANKKAEIVAQTNAFRAKQNLAPLILCDELSQTAQAYALAMAQKGGVENKPTSLQRIVNSGVYARFALSALVVAPTAEKTFSQLMQNPLHAGKLQHSGITHIGLGLVVQNQTAYLVVDMARLVEKLNPTQIADDFFSKINQNRARIGISPLRSEPKLEAAANDLTQKFMQSGTHSEILISEAKVEISKKHMALGKITIAFQTAGSLDEISLPERTSDPNATFVGIAVAQGNWKSQDAGAIVVTLILATPQNNATSANAKHLPKPRAMPSGHKSNPKASLEERAWLATLVGNHKKAAALFEKNFRRTKDPQFIYECARAHARNNDIVQSLNTMERYAALCKNRCSDDQIATARKMIAKLRAGESIFTTTKEAQYSVEAKRFFILGQKLFAGEQWEGAIDAFSQAYAYAPHPDLIYNMGLAHLKNGAVGDALDFFQEYQRQVPEAQNAEQAKQLFQIGVELYNVGQFESAAKRFTMAYSFLPIEEILFNLALCHKAMNDTDEALRLLQELADKTTDKDQKKEYIKMIRELSP